MVLRILIGIIIVAAIILLLAVGYIFLTVALMTMAFNSKEEEAQELLEKQRQRWEERLKEEQEQADRYLNSLNEGTCLKDGEKDCDSYGGAS